MNQEQKEKIIKALVEARAERNLKKQSERDAEYDRAVAAGQKAIDMLKEIGGYQRQRDDIWGAFYCYPGTAPVAIGARNYQLRKIARSLV